MSKTRKRSGRVRELNPYGPKALTLARKKAKKLWYEYIHSLGDTCDAIFEFTGCGGPLQGGHIFGKGPYKSVEFDPLNGRLICRDHHCYFGNPSGHYIEWEIHCRHKMGDEAFEALRARALKKGPGIYEQIAVLEKLLDKTAIGADVVRETSEVKP